MRCPFFIEYLEFDACAYFKINIDDIISEEELLNKIKEGRIADKIVICRSTINRTQTVIPSLPHSTHSEQMINGFNLELDQLHLWPAIEIMATTEDKPGFKDYGEIMDILEFIEDHE